MYIYIYICIYYGLADLLTYGHCVFLETKFFFHINAFKAEINPYCFKCLYEKREKYSLRSNFLVFEKSEFYLA